MLISRNVKTRSFKIILYYNMKIFECQLLNNNPKGLIDANEFALNYGDIN